MSVNYYAINKVLGAQMVSGQRPRFGGFGVLSTVGAALANKPRDPLPVHFTYDMDRKVVEAFESIREGKAPERVLWDVDLARRFHRAAKSLGLHAPSSQLDRRLINIRKNPGRYKMHGIELSSSTEIDPQPSVVPEYAHVLEFALVRLRYRYGVSIDDILLDPKLVAEYENMARQVAKGLSSAQLRLGALYIRKTRFLKKIETNLFDELDASEFEAALADLGTLDNILPSAIPAQEGLLEVLERDRYLYIARNENLRAVVEQFVKGPTLEMMSNAFWSPEPNRIRMRFYSGATFQNTAVRRWQLKLIHDREPVFNWPVAAEAA